MPIECRDVAAHIGHITHLEQIVGVVIREREDAARPVV